MPTSADRVGRRIGGLPLVLLLVTLPVAGCDAAAPIASPASHDLVIATEPGSGLQFLPDRATAAGPRLRLLFRNDSSLPHNLTFERLGARTETIVSPGRTQIVEVDAPGPGDYAFVCTIHPEMRGELRIS